MIFGKKSWRVWGETVFFFHAQKNRETIFGLKACSRALNFILFYPPTITPPRLHFAPHDSMGKKKKTREKFCHLVKMMYVVLGNQRQFPHCSLIIGVCTVFTM